MYLSGTKDAIKAAIEDKGVAVPEETTFREYADKISQISGGGGAWVPVVAPEMLGGTRSGSSYATKGSIIRPNRDIYVSAIRTYLRPSSTADEYKFTISKLESPYNDKFIPLREERESKVQEVLWESPVPHTGIRANSYMQELTEDLQSELILSAGETYLLSISLVNGTGTTPIEVSVISPPGSDERDAFPELSYYNDNYQLLPGSFQLDKTALNIGDVPSTQGAGTYVIQVIGKSYAHSGTPSIYSVRYNEVILNALGTAGVLSSPETGRTSVFTVLTDINVKSISYILDSDNEFPWSIQIAEVGDITRNSAGVITSYTVSSVVGVTEAIVIGTSIGTVHLDFVGEVSLQKGKFYSLGIFNVSRANYLRASSTSTTFTGATSARQALNAACKAEPGILSYAGTGFEVGVSSSDLLNGNYILLLPFQYTVPQLPPP